jgi:hypothetical protein
MGIRPQGTIGFDPPPPDVFGVGVAPSLSSLSAHGPDGGRTGLHGGGPQAAAHVTGWPRNLTWADFPEVASAPDASDENAQIHAEITQPTNVGVVHEHGQVRISSLTVNLSVDRGDSWVVRSAKADDLLSHEQGHFDITGMMGRDMGAEIMAARASSTGDLQTAVTAIIQRYRTLAKTLNDRYDTETNHGRNREAQARWDARIRSSMQSGARFTTP